MYRVPNLRDSIFFRRVPSRVPCSIRGLFVFVLLLFGQHPISTTPHCRVCRLSEPSSSHRRCHAASTILILLVYSAVPCHVDSISSSLRLPAICLRCSYSCAIVRSSCPRRLRLRLRHLIISLLLYRYLHCRYPGGLFGFHVAILAPRSSPVGGMYCHKPRVTALAHLLKAVL